MAIVPSPNEVKREGGSRRIDVTCDAKGQDLGTVARKIEEAVKAIPFEREYHPEFLGEYAARQESQQRLLLFGAAAFAAILLLLYVDFQSLRLTLLVSLTIPFASLGELSPRGWSGEH